MNVISTVDAQSIVDNQMPREIEEGVHPFDKTCFLSNKRQWRRREKRPHYHEYGGVKQYNMEPHLWLNNSLGAEVWGGCLLSTWFYNRNEKWRCCARVKKGVEMNVVRVRFGGVEHKFETWDSTDFETGGEDLGSRRIAHTPFKYPGSGGRSLCARWVGTHQHPAIPNFDSEIEFRFSYLLKYAYKWNFTKSITYRTDLMVLGTTSLK